MTCQVFWRKIWGFINQIKKGMEKNTQTAIPYNAVADSWYSTFSIFGEKWNVNFFRQWVWGMQRGDATGWGRLLHSPAVSSLSSLPPARSSLLQLENLFQCPGLPCLMYDLFLNLKIRNILVSDAGSDLTLIFSDVWFAEVSIADEVINYIVFLEQCPQTGLVNLQQSHVPIDGHTV
jgi:hypothetical protein